MELIIRNAKGVKGEVQGTRYRTELKMWISVNQAGHTMKKWGLRYTDATGKRQKVRMRSYPELTLAKAYAAAEDLKEKAKTGLNLAKENAKKSLPKYIPGLLKALLWPG